MHATPTEPDPGLTPRQKQLTSLAYLALAIPFLLIAFAWGDLPERIPIHFNAAGEADGWGNRFSILLLPVILGGTILTMLLVAAHTPAKTLNVPFKITEQNAAEHYRLARDLLVHLGLAIALMGIYLSWETLQVALDRQSGLSSLALPVILLATFLPIGYYYWRARSVEG